MQMEAVNILATIAGTGALLIGLGCIVRNYALLAFSLWNERLGMPKRYSPVPLVGPILLTFLWSIVDMAPGMLHWFILASWLVDPGTWVPAVALLARKRQRRLRQIAHTLGGGNLGGHPNDGDVRNSRGL